MASVPQQTTYLKAYEIDKYSEDGEVWDREKLCIRLNDPVFMKEDVSDTYVFGKPFALSAQLPKRPVPLRRLHNFYMTASALGVRNITFVVPENAFWSGSYKASIEWEDLWLMYHKRWLDINLVLVWCL